MKPLFKCSVCSKKEAGEDKGLSRPKTPEGWFTETRKKETGSKQISIQVRKHYCKECKCDI